MTKYQKDLPEHMKAPVLLYNRYRSMFRGNHCCDNLYQLTNAKEDPSFFSQKLISATANYDRSKTSMLDIPNRPFHTEKVTYSTEHHLADITLDATTPASSHENCSLFRLHGLHPDAVSNLVAFFAKTPPPPRHKRLNRFQCFRSSNFYRGYRRRLPFRFRRNNFQRGGPHRKRRACFGCGEEGLYLRDCPNKSKHLSRFQHFVDLGTAAAYFLEHDCRDLEDDDMEMLSFFTTSEEDLTSDDYNQDDDEIYAWIVELLDACDVSLTPYGNLANGSTHSRTDYLQQSIPELSYMMSDLICYSSTSVNENVLMDTGVPRTICSEEWLAS